MREIAVIINIIMIMIIIIIIIITTSTSTSTTTTCGQYTKYSGTSAAQPRLQLHSSSAVTCVTRHTRHLCHTSHASLVSHVTRVTCHSSSAAHHVTRHRSHVSHVTRVTCHKRVLHRSSAKTLMRQRKVKANVVVMRSIEGDLS